MGGMTVARLALMQMAMLTLSIARVQGYQRNGLITPEELALIKKVDKQPRAKTESLLLSDGRTYALLYLGLLKKLQRVDTISCILVLIADAVTGARSVADMVAPALIPLAHRSRRTYTPLHTRSGNRPGPPLCASPPASHPCAPTHLH
jgi:hypothetical protein